MKIPDIILNALLKKALGGNIKNFKTVVEIPGQSQSDQPIKVTISAESLNIKLEKDGNDN